MGVSDAQLYKLLKGLDVVDEKELLALYRQSEKEKVPFQELVIQKDILSDENLGEVVADFLKVPFISLAKQSIPRNVLTVVPERVARANRIIVFDVSEKGVGIATSDPENLESIQLVSKKVGLKPRVYYCTDRDIEEALSLYKEQIKSTFDAMLQEEVSKVGKSIDKEAPIAKIVDTLIEYGYDYKASDIHIEPNDEESLVRFRIDGVLHDMLHLPKNLHEQIVTRIKVLSKLRTDEHLSAQDGKMQAKLEKETVDVRVSLVPIVEGEKCVMRLLTSHNRQFGLTDLGMSGEDLDKIKRSMKKPFGIIVSTGPTGSGKTTSMYSILKILNTREVNIATIEDPVEYEIEGINQIQVNNKTNLTFAEGLRSILRQDPNIIYVGEIRDEETAGIAINSAMTGHLVLSTLHTNNAATSLPRLVDMNIEPYLIASTVNVIIAQRLVRKICSSCKVSYTIEHEKMVKYFSEEVLKKYFPSGEKEIRVFHGKGCAVCNKSGYSGRIGIFEVLIMSEKIEELLVAKADAAQINKAAIEEGMTTMFEDGLKKIQQGGTTVEEILRATKEQ